MALWGNNDNVGSDGLVSLDYSTGVVTGSGTTFGNVGAAATGDVIRFGDRAGTYFGDAVIVGIASTTQLTIGSTAGLSGAAIASTSFSVSQLPKYTILDSHYSEVNTDYDSHVYGVSPDESEVSTFTSYDVTHAGWVGVTTYTGSEGEMRVKTETLVAMSSIVNDADDDIVFPDALITILSQPESQSVGVGTTATFSVTATVVPEGSTLSYQWQEDDGGGFGDLVGETGTSVSIANTDISKDGYEYQVVIATGDTSVTSGIATLSVA